MNNNDNDFVLSPQIIYDGLSKQVIGQESVKRSISNAVFMHYLRCYRYFTFGTPYGPKSNILIIGPSGCGKTHIMKTLESELIDIPVLHLDATAMTKYGFAGSSIEDYLINWKRKNSMAEYGIVFIDEIDKLCVKLSSTKDEDWNKTLQQSLLKVIEGTMIQDGSKTFNTENVLFIFGGNFKELRDLMKAQSKKQGIGFMDTSENAGKKWDIDRLHNELIKIGLIQELTGRIAIINEVKELSKKELKKIFMNPNGGPYTNYQDLFHILNEDLELSDYHINKIIDHCYETKIGARGLQTALDDYLQKKIFEIPNINFGN